MICEISRLNTLDFNGGWMIWKKKKKKKIIEGNQGELAKDLSMIKSNFSLEFKYSEWMNSGTYFSLVRHPFYKEF